MKTRISLLVMCLTFIAYSLPTSAEVANCTAPIISKRIKDLEMILSKSKLCKDYPNVVRISNDNKATIATYADRKSSDTEIKILALKIANLVCNNASNVTLVKVRFYDPASTKYWRDAILTPDQIKNQTTDSIEILNNLGLTDGPSLQPRASAYKRILALQHSGVPVESFLSQLAEIETAVKHNKNIDKQLSKLNSDLNEADASLTDTVIGRPSTGAVIDSLKQDWQDACERERKALQNVEESEQEQNSLRLPESFASFSDMDARARSDNDFDVTSTKLNKALAAWHQATQDRDIAYSKYMQAKENN